MRDPPYGPLLLSLPPLPLLVLPSSSLHVVFPLTSVCMCWLPPSPRPRPPSLNLSLTCVCMRLLPFHMTTSDISTSEEGGASTT